MTDTTRAILAAGTLVALAATAGSLYFSLGLGLTPCDLCWYQRILMYPLVVVLGVAAVEDRGSIWKTVLPLSLGGVALAGYHTYLQVAGGPCTLGGPCSSVLYPMMDGLLTIPRLSLIAFSLLTLVTVAAARADKSRDNMWMA